jgi:PAS domain S-box-containing protein
MENHPHQRFDQIRNLLKSQRRGLSISEIANYLGLQRHLVSKDLAYLQQMGQVEMVSIGSSKVFSYAMRKPLFGILDYTSNAIILLNDEGIIVEINEPLLSLVNLSREDLLGRRMVDCPGPLFPALHPDSCETESIEEVAIGDPLPEDPKAIRHFRIKYIPTVFEDATKGIIIFIEEITEQIRYRDALLLSEEQYKTIVEKQTELIFRFMPDGTITYANWKFSTVFGLTESDIRGINFFSLFPEGDLADFKGSLDKLKDSDQVRDVTMRLQTADGIHKFSGTIQAIYSKSNRLLGYHGIARDITREVTTQEEKERYYAHLELLCRKSHDFLTSMDDRAIIGHISTGISETVPGSLVFVFTYDESSGKMKAREIRDAQGINILHTLLSGDDFQESIPPSVFGNDEQFGAMIRGKIKEISPELGASLMGVTLTTRLQITGARRIFATLMDWEGSIMGAVVICSSDELTPDVRTVCETLIRMGAFNLQRYLTRQYMTIFDNRFKIIAKNAPIPIAMISANGEYLFINKKFTETFGYTLEDIPTGKKWFLHAFPDAATMQKARALWVSDLQASSPGEMRPRKFSVHCKDGSFKTIIFRPVTLVDGCQLVLYEDITHVEVAEQDRNLLAEIVRSSHDAIIGMTTDGRIQTWNPGAERLYGYTADEVQGNDIGIIFPLDLLEEKERLLARVGKGEFILDFETRRKRKDKKIIDVSVTISPIFDHDQHIIGTSTIVRDISARKAEERLKDLESQYRDMVDSINVGIYRSTGDPEGRFLWGNSSLVRILGYPSIESVKEVPVSGMFLHAHGRNNLLNELKEQGFVRNREILLKRPDGSVAYVLVTALATFSEDGNIDYINGIVEDITEQRILEKKLASLQQSESEPYGV